METNAFVTDDQLVSSLKDFNRAYPPLKTFSFYRMLAFSVFGAALFILAIILAMPEGAGINWLAIGLAFVGIYIAGFHFFFLLISLMDRSRIEASYGFKISLDFVFRKDLPADFEISSQPPEKMIRFVLIVALFEAIVSALLVAFL